MTCFHDTLGNIIGSLFAIALFIGVCFMAAALILIMMDWWKEYSAKWRRLR